MIIANLNFWTCSDCGMCRTSGGIDFDILDLELHMAEVSDLTEVPGERNSCCRGYKN